MNVCFGFGLWNVTRKLLSIVHPYGAPGLSNRLFSSFTMNLRSSSSVLVMSNTCVNRRGIFRTYSPDWWALTWLTPELERMCSTRAPSVIRYSSAALSTRSAGACGLDTRSIQSDCRPSAGIASAMIELKVLRSDEPLMSSSTSRTVSFGAFRWNVPSSWVTELICDSVGVAPYRASASTGRKSKPR